MVWLLDKTHLMFLKPFFYSFETRIRFSLIPFIPQGTVDNNLWPGRLTSPKALDPNHCRQPTI